MSGSGSQSSIIEDEETEKLANLRKRYRHAYFLEIET